MANTTARFDPSIVVDTQFRVARRGSIIFEFYNSSGDAVDMYETEWEFLLKKQPNGPNVLRLTTGAGNIVVEGSSDEKVRINITETESNIQALNYYYEIYRPDLKKTWFTGTCFASNGAYNASLNQEFVTTSTDEQVVRVELNSSGSPVQVTLASSSSGTLQEAYDNGDGTVTLTTGKPFDIISDSGVTLFRVRDSGTRILIQSASGMLLATIAGNMGMTAAGDLFISSSATGGNKTLTTIGGNLFAIPNPSAIKLIRIKADNTVEVINPNEFIGIACSDETTALAAASTSVPIATFHAPYALLLTRVFAGLRTAGTGAAVVTVDIHVNGTTIMSGTKILFTASQKLSADGVISTTSIAAGDYVEIFLDQRDTDNVATGLKTYLVGYKNS